MKPELLNERLYQQLGLLYDSNYFSSQLTNDPMGQLDPPAFIEGKEACWQALSTSKVTNKRALILTSWYFQYLDQDTCSALTQFFSDLIDEGFAIYLPQDGQLIKMASGNSLRIHLRDFTPITTTTARAMAAEIQLSHGRIDVINLQRLHAITKFIKKNNVDPYAQGISQQLSDDSPELSSDLSAQQIQNIETLIEPSDKLSYTLNDHSNKLLQSQLHRHICSLKIDGDKCDLSDESLDVVDALCSTIEQLTIVSSTLTAEQLNSIMIKIPNLTKINIDYCTRLGFTLLNLPEQLSHLKELCVSHSGFTIEQIVAIVAKAPNLEIINLFECTELGLAVFNLPEQLTHLTELNVGDTSITFEQLASILTKTPHLTKISLCFCDEIEIEPLLVMLGQLSYLIEIDIRYMKLTGEQLASMLTNIPTLRKIYISGCPNLGSASLNIPEQLSHLTELEAYNASLTAEQLSSILLNAPNLTKIIISGSHRSGVTPYSFPKQLSHLTELDVSGTAITAEQLTAIFTNAPNLAKIDLSSCHYLGFAPLNVLIQLSYLTELKANYSTINAAQVVSILTKTPNITKLNLSNCNALGSTLFNLPERLIYLRELNLNGTNVTAEQFSSLLTNAPNLVNIDLFFGQNMGSSPLHLPEKLNYLTKLRVGSDSINDEQFMSIFTRAPNLTRLNISDSRGLVEALLSLPGKLDHLLEINVSYISAEQLAALRIKAPNLTKIDFLISTRSQIVSNEIIPDGTSSSNNDVTMRQLFVGQTDNNPFPGSYHLTASHWGGDGDFKKNSPVSLEPLPFIPHSALQTVHNAFKENTNYKSPHHFYAQIKLDALNPGQWYQLPALSTVDQLLDFAADFGRYEVQRDTHYGYYYLRVDKAVSSGLINYIIKSKPNPSLSMRDPLANLQPLIAALQLNEDGEIVQNEAFHQLSLHTINVLIQAITTFCSFPDFKTPTISGTTLERLNQLIKLRSGACSHRARLFVALAAGLDIEANLITNDGHEFVMVFDETHTAKTIDLGGAPANITEIAMDTFAIPAPRPTLPAENPFQTWNTLPLSARDVPSLAQELLSSSQHARRLIILKEEGATIEALHDAVLKTSTSCFFTPNLDMMWLKTLKAGEGQYQVVDNQLAAFLKNTQQHPEEQFTWFINWSNPKAEHVGLNSIIDDKDRRLGAIEIPANLHIVALMDSASAAEMGEDFYSRFDAISQAFELNLPLNTTITETITPIAVEDALLTTSYDWENVLLGYYHISGRNIQFMPGSLLQAMDAQFTRLRIHNAPWENPKFRWFMTELQDNRRFYVNGSWHTLPTGLQIDYVRSEFNYPELPSNLAVETAELILNPVTYACFFPHHRVDATGSIELCPGVLPSSQSVKLLVTGELSEAQWYQLWQHAANHHCNITLQCAPQIAIPVALKPWVEESATLKPQGSVALIVSKDLDYVAAQYKHTVQIPVSPGTRFESLFFHVHRQEQGFMSEETALLQAIRNGESVVFKGRFSEELVQRMQTLFTKIPSLYINGETISIKGSIVLLSDDQTPFAAIDAQTISYDPETDLQQLNEPLQQQLRTLYQSLNITPCHSHFTNVTNLQQQLQLMAGKSLHPTKAMEPKDVLSYLKQHPFVFLISETGAGKSYFVQHVLPAYGKTIGRDIKIHHGLDSLKAWAEGQGDSVLFVDEANLSAEQFNLFDNLARGEQVIWIDGQCYPLTSKHKIIFAGNPKQYEGRFEADLFKRFPYYLEFKGQPLGLILNPLLECFENKQALLPMIETYYQQAIEAGLNITPRNAQMMCLTAFALKQLPLTQHLPEEFLLRYAVLNEIQSLISDATLTQSLSDSLEKEGQWEAYKKAINEALSPTLQSNDDFIWTESRQKIAMTIQLLLTIRDHKIKQKIDQATGVNALLLEGEAGLGKSRLLIDLLQAQQIPYIIIATGNPELMRRQLLQAFHEGKIALIDEFNTFPDEKLLNALLSGVDLEGHPATTPGFCLLGTQNPITYAGRQPLSKALSNRLIKLNLNHYSPSELQSILIQKFKISSQTAQKLTAQFIQAREYAHTQKLFPQPNTRTIFNKAEKMKGTSTDESKEPPEIPTPST